MQDKKPKNIVNVIKNLEEAVLAHSGVEPFEEILKLIYAKVYYEKKNKNGSIFMTKGLDDKEKYKKLLSLFEDAKKEWDGMFENGSNFELDQSQLLLCAKEFDNLNLYKTDLSIIDTAFEYLLPKSAKGSRGQYFTPRHVICEIIRILNPKSNDKILDPACGGGGFLLHAVDWVTKKDNKHYGLNNKISKVAQNVYGIDIDPRMVRIAKALLLLAGFDSVRLVNANSLGKIKGLKNDGFDVICTNPPFGGEVKDIDLLSKFVMSKKGNGILKYSVERHILFIERIINLLKPGGRACIVVPQGILNNTNLNYVREWLYTKARIVGVIGLDLNTFKPHTNVKTSLLFLQKWENKPLTDYPVFMAVSQSSGKNYSGNLVYKLKNKKKVVDTDLPRIGTNFRSFIEREKLGF